MRTVMCAEVINSPTSRKNGTAKSVSVLTPLKSWPVIEASEMCVKQTTVTNTLAISANGTGTPKYPSAIETTTMTEIARPALVIRREPAPT